MRALAAFAALPLVIPVLAVPVLAAPVLAAPGAVEDVRLSLKFQAGDVLRYRFVQVIDQSLSGETAMDTSTTIAQVLKQTVKMVSDEGVATTECSWEALKVHVDMAEGDDVEYDSTLGVARESLPAGARIFAGVVGLSFEIKTKPNGELLSLHGIPEAREKALSGVAAGDPLMPMVTQMLAEEAIRQLLEIAVLPEKPLAIGDSWARDVEVRMDLIPKVKVHGQHTLAGLESTRGARCAKVGLERQLSVVDGNVDLASTSLADEAEVTMTIDQSTSAGTLYYSLEPGRLVRSELQTRLSMTMRVKAKGKGVGVVRPTETKIEMIKGLQVLLLGADEPAFEPEKKAEKKAAK